MKTRMHEILGVEPGELFEHLQRGLFYFVDSAGAVRECPDKDTNNWHHSHAPGHVISSMINLPEGIIRKPRLTAEQVEWLKAMRLLGYKYLTVTHDGAIKAYPLCPQKDERGGWEAKNIKNAELRWDNPFNDMFVDRDTEPLDILQTLREVDA